ncbi:MAG: FtsK/SpoIIIE domain-containing protein [Actinomycetota bacterium]
MKLSLHSPEAELDVDVTAGNDTVVVADVFTAAGLTVGDRVLIDGRTPCDPQTPLTALALGDGTTLVSRIDDRDHGDTDTAVAELICVAGPGAGSRTLLNPGTFDLCQVTAAADPTLRSSVFRVEVSRSGSVRLGALAGTEVQIDGERAGEELRTGAWIAAGPSVFRIARHEPGHERSLTPPGPRTSFVRSPRVIEEPRGATVVAPKPPPEPRPPEPLSLIVMLFPLPIGLALAYFLSPFYLVFVLLSPIMALGRTVDGKRRVARGTRENAIQRQRDLDQFEHELRVLRADAAAHQRAARRDLHQLVRSATTADTGLWRSRSGHDDFLRPVVGVGSSTWAPEILGDTSPSDIEALIADATVLPMCPVTIDLHQGLALGVVGPADAARRLAAAVVTQLATEHGPADVQLAALVDHRAAPFWDHLKWLPHLRDEGGTLRVATSVAGAEEVVAALVHEPERSLYRAADTPVETPIPIFVVDSGALVDDGLRSLSSRLPRVPARAVVVAETVDQLPAFCTSLAAIHPVSGRVTLTDVGTGRRVSDVVGLLPEREVCHDAARALACFVDPDAPDQAQNLPAFARLRDMLATRPDADSVRHTWERDHGPGDVHTQGRGRRRVTSCRAVLGVTESGPLEIDLVADGPHALIAGTTGAGKSELLRTMVVSLAARYRPDELNVVLIDFKGGGAFDVFARLPHNVGVVTDLDEHLASRALQCLRAELRYREHRLRDAGVNDIGDLEPEMDNPLPRLAIIVDEFATLAAELPEFLNSLVDVAQRGRSLGIHLVLATQRPSGVIDGKIRANTNLRIALRVQDDHDSNDVIGSGAAADIDRRVPGRALARFGASELVGFQTALVSMQSQDQVGPALRLDTFELVGPTSGAVLAPIAETNDPHGAGNTGGRPEAVADSDRITPPTPTDIVCYVEATRVAAQKLGIADPRVPWPDPLPATLSAEQLLADADVDGGVVAGTGKAGTSDDSRGHGAAWTTPFGLADRPDEQRREPAWWGPSDGNLLVYGLGPAPAAQAVSTVALGLAHRHGADDFHLYVLDYVGSLSALSTLPHVGAYVTSEDDERLLRTVQRIEDELDRRRAIVRDHGLDGIDPSTGAAHGLPLTVLAVANYGAVVETFEEIGDLGGANRLARIVRDGPAVGVFVFIAAGSERDVPGRVAQQIETKLLTRMADPNAYLLFGLRPKEVPELGSGRAIDTRTQRQLQIAQFGDGDLRASVEARSWEPADRGPNRVEVLRRHIPFDEVVGSCRADGSTWHLSIAIGHDRLEPVGPTLRDAQHLVVAGPPGSGRTTALQAVAAAARCADPDAVLAIVTPNPSEWDDLRVSLGLTTLDYLLSPESDESPGRRALVLVDDVETAPMPSEVLQGVAAQPPAGIHLAVAGRPESFRLSEPWARAVLASRSGIALRPSPETGELFRCRFPHPRNAPPPGRGYVVDQGRAELGQVVVVPRTEPVGDDVLLLTDTRSADSALREEPTRPIDKTADNETDDNMNAHDAAWSMAGHGSEGSSWRHE